ncbi:MAG: lipopolysaccharide heptosyltransferase II [Candidatus Omnitrophica bacterium]|nr:lipopolysaccharide heptosyltransferase II [Candidatus Omnitrophota bacterium]
MHILQLVPTLAVGGVERGVLDLAKGAIARGHRVSVISAGGPLVEPLTSFGAVHYALPVHEKSLSRMLSCIPAVADIMTSTGVDVVHARSRIPAWIGWAAARRTQRPFITTAHGFYRPHAASRVMGWGRTVIVPSEALARYLMEHFRVPKERLRVIPRGVDLEEFSVRPSPPSRDGPWRVGVFGRLSATKGHEVAIRACAKLQQKGLPIRLVMAGDTPGSPARQMLDALIKSLKLDDAVEWLGIRYDVAALMGTMDLILVPSTYPESFGRGVVEAQAVGRPVIASRIGALAELIDDGQNGLLVPPRDPKALADAIERLLHDPALRQRCVARGRAQVEAKWPAGRMVERTLAVYDECLTRPRILIWKLSALGDVVLSTPSLRAIRRRWPSAHLTLIVGRLAYDVVARCPYLDDVIIYDKAGKDRGPLGHAKLLRRLAAGRFDQSIDLQNSRKTHLLAWLAGIPVRMGYNRKCGGCLNRAVRLPRVILAPMAHQHYLLRHLGIEPAGEELELWPSPLDEQTAERLLTLPPSTLHLRPLVGMQPGGSGRWKTKRWDLARWAAVCNALTKQGVRVVVTGGSQEQGIASALAQLTSPLPHIVVGKTTLMELACLIKRCDLFLAHDSSALHLAAAMRVPTIALFGPTDPARHLPPNFLGEVIKKDVFCSPCYSPRCRTLTHACMNRISVEEVLKVVLGRLAMAEASGKD